jgi:hypothetical protein
VFSKHRTPRREPPPELADPAVAADDLRLAYERGRRDERAARKHHPVLMTLTVAVAVVGAVVLALAAREGSFARGGARFDQGVSVAAARAEPAVRDAASDASAALKDAGQSLNDDKPDTAG